MTTYVTLTHERTGETRSIKVGWSWTLFLFSPFWGLPLFYRRLFDWGMIQFVLCLFYYYLFAPPAASEDLAASIIFGLPSLGIAIFLGLNGNELTAKQFLREGWSFADVSSPISQNARQAWSLPHSPAPFEQAGDN